MLKTVALNRKNRARHQDGDPDCKFTKDEVTIHYNDQSEVRMYKSSQWAISNKYGEVVTFDLRGHPEQHQMNKAMKKVEDNWLLDCKLGPVLQRGFVRTDLKNLSFEGDEIADNGVEDKPEMVIYVCQDVHTATIDFFGKPIQSGLAVMTVQSHRDKRKV